ncbi:MAG TPA: MFS transporter [Nitrolancea sp.]|nr:MFS transporter [Nitrolancea sp.]
MAKTQTATPRASALRNRPLITLALGHFTIDLYAGLLPILFPVLIARFGLDLKTVGFVTLAYSGMGSISQPLFGWLADRIGTRLIGAALIWTAATFSAIAFAPSFNLILLFAAAAGLGSGAFHPFGALNASAVIPDKQRNSAMAIYTSGGTIGFAIGPLIGVVLLKLFNLHGVAAMLIPGTLIAVWLLYEIRFIAVRPAARLEQARQHLPAIPKLPMIAVVAVMMARSWNMSSIQAYVPSWYKSLGYSETFYAALATVITLASAVGTLGSGSLADRFGRRKLILASLLLTVPTVLLFAQFTGPIAFVTGTLVGLLAASTAPLLLVMAQQIMRGRAGIASGLILGIGFVTGAIGVPITGAVADAVGIQMAMRLQVVVVFLVLPLALLLPTESRIEQIHEASAVAADD